LLQFKAYADVTRLLTSVVPYQRGAPCLSHVYGHLRTTCWVL